MIGIDAVDQKIIRLLDKNPSYPSEISKKLGVVRTTVHYRLERLRRMKRVKHIDVGRKSIWSPVYGKEHNKAIYRVYKGEEITQAYAHMLNLPRKTVIYCVQGRDAAKGEFQNLPRFAIKGTHALLKRRGIIIKSVSHESVVDIFRQLDEAMIRSHIGRIMALKLFSGDVFLGSGELLSSKEFLVLSNPTARAAVVIKDKGIASIVNDTLKIFFDILDNTKNFDLNRYLKT
ncbi:MAG: AsnC family transcriptional regulator [Candidatus Liptonbacteria bacterium]|nr:AsnC family transcriptional regulator [Candidatus Liptonbacteria bacterium]